jgi:hypothetical protein
MQGTLAEVTVRLVQKVCPLALPKKVFQTRSPLYDLATMHPEFREKAAKGAPRLQSHIRDINIAAVCRYPYRRE